MSFTLYAHFIFFVLQFPQILSSFLIHYYFFLSTIFSDSNPLNVIFRENNVSLATRSFATAQEDSVKTNQYCSFDKERDSGVFHIMPRIGWLISDACHADTEWSQKVNSYECGGACSTSWVKMGPARSNSDTWKQQMFPKQARFIHCVIVLLSITPRCVVCVGVTALCMVHSDVSSSAAREQSYCSSSALLQQNKQGKKEDWEKCFLCTPITSLIGTECLYREVHSCHILKTTKSPHYVLSKCCSDSHAWRVPCDVGSLRT